MKNNEVYVHIALGNETIRVGTLWFYARKGRESASFEYDKHWLENPERFALEPALQLTEGTFHTSDGRHLFGSIGDSAPDRWGRVLMRRANGSSRTLLEVDYLLGVNDYARQGALRFSRSPNDENYLASNDQAATPPLIELPKLLSATEHFLNKNESEDDLKLLLAPGSSLGGARPKASVIDQDGQLAIAKFPRTDDEYNLVIWEAIALMLAEKAGVRVPNWRLETILGKPVLIIHRFDRSGEHRIPFLSAMSMLGANDNEQHSYLEIVYALAQHGADPENDMHELWRRIVFTVLISNTDDHLRNHGFLYQRGAGWRLSPVYDVNPTPTNIKPRILATAIDFNDTTASLEAAMSVASEFRVSKQQACETVKEVAQAVKAWRHVAARFKLAKREIDDMSSAFEHEDLEAGLRL